MKKNLAIIAIASVLIMLSACGETIPTHPVLHNMPSELKGTYWTSSTSDSWISFAGNDVTGKIKSKFLDGDPLQINIGANYNSQGGLLNDSVNSIGEYIVTHEHGSGSEVYGFWINAEGSLQVVVDMNGRTIGEDVLDTKR